MPRWRWGLIFVLWGGVMGTYTAQPNVLKCEIFGWVPYASCIGKNVYDPEGRRRISAATCRIAWPHAAIGNLELSSNGREINWSHFINDSANPFWVLTCATGCSTLIPVAEQKSKNTLDVNSPALSSLIFLIWLSGKCASNFRIWAKSYANAKLWVDKRQA